MADKPQTFASHRRFIPAFHFFVLPVLYINVAVVGYFLVRYPNLVNFWRLLVAIALATGMSWSRFMPLRAQDRIIRLEERARLERVLPTDMRGRIGELTPSQLIAIRFAEDEEVADLTHRTLSGELKTPGEIKRAIRNWRSDHLRV
jgi:Family of unknown function (DUF6526)